MLRTRIVMLSLVILGGIACSSNGIESTGMLESPCQSSSDCLTGLCLQLPEYSICTRRCTDHWSGACPDGYACVPQGSGPDDPEICVPDPAIATMCRDTLLPCGSRFAQCCEGLVCAAWSDVPWHCARTCWRDVDCGSGCCVETAGHDVGVCAPPSFCD